MIDIDESDEVTLIVDYVDFRHSNLYQAVQY